MGKMPMTQEWNDERIAELIERAAAAYDGREDGDPPDTDERWERWLIRAAVEEARREQRAKDAEIAHRHTSRCAGHTKPVYCTDWVAAAILAQGERDE